MPGMFRAPVEAPISREPVDPIRAPVSGDPVRSPSFGGGGPEPISGGNPPRRVMGSFEHGGDVPATGAYKLHEGEHVTPAKSTSDPEGESQFHRAFHHLNHGALHRHLGIPEGTPIPLEEKEKAAKSPNKHVAAMGRLAVAMHGWKK